MPGTLDIPGSVLLAQAVNRRHPLNPGRVAWYLTLTGLEGGRRYDLMGVNAATLQDMSGASVSGWRGTTRPGGSGSLLFDYVDDQAVVPGPTIPTGSPITIALRVNVPSTPASGAGAFTIGGLDHPDRCQLPGPYPNNDFYWDYGESISLSRCQEINWTL